MKACFRWAQIQKRLSSPGKSTVSKQTAAFRMGCGLVRQFSKKPTRATAWRRCSVLLIGSGQTNTLWNTVSVRMTAIQKAGAAAGRRPHSAEGWLLTEQHRLHGSLSSWRVSEGMASVRGTASGTSAFAVGEAIVPSAGDGPEDPASCAVGLGQRSHDPRKGSMCTTRDCS